jgi:hypothetical protein
MTFPLPSQNAGAVVWAGAWRVGGVLAVSRAIGDRLQFQDLQRRLAHGGKTVHQEHEVRHQGRTPHHDPVPFLIPFQIPQFQGFRQSGCPRQSSHWSASPQR